ncbi:MAG: NAD-dependent DNA ligase LigA, partial [Firmicutes bacterium]|nr:NAD-dependent DNA ligase LigA [Bacillota bacterium]
MTQEKEKVDRPELIEEIKSLIETPNKASLAYYQEAREIMPNYEYDALYDRLQELENITGVVFSNSPTQNVGYEVLSELPKEAHPQKMLSLDKTKDVGALRSFVGDHEALMSWKLDGLTVVLTYRDGSLAKAVTRGNGEIGEVITNNARVFANVPLNIEFKGETVLRGEAVITYDEFERINASITDEGAKYKNPRNLCSGSVRQLDPAITKQRRVRFFAFS